MEVWRSNYMLLQALPHSQCSSVEWQGAESSCLLAMAPAVAGHGAPRAADIASLLPCPHEMMIHQLDHTELHAHGHLLIYCQNQEQKTGPLAPTALSWDFFCKVGGGWPRWLKRCCHADEKSFNSTVPCYWNRCVNRPGNSTEGTALSAASSITMIGDNRT